MSLGACSPKPIRSMKQETHEVNLFQERFSMSTTPLISNTSSSATTRSVATKNSGKLTATILSAYDLPNRDPPSYVSLTVGSTTVKTGPPAQRHKDRNSFKFNTPTNGNRNTNQLEITAPLPDLYKATATVQVVYQQQPQQTLEATYKLNSLKIHETTWLILNLEGQRNNTSTSEEQEWEVPPTLRLQMTLDGPYRTEIAALVSLCEAWFGVVDNVERHCQTVAARTPKLPDPKYLLVPAAPLLAIVVVSLPVLVGVLLVGLPMILPIVIVVGVVSVILGTMGTLVYCSTHHGRSQVGVTLAPLAHTVLSTPSGQTLVYQTGPRPTPVKVARAILPTGLWGKLIVSLLIDLTGSASYLLPVVGEAVDILWAPAQTVLIMAMYDSVSPNLKYVSFIEEILPLTDIVPSASIGWLMEFGLPMVLGDSQPQGGSTALTRSSAAAAQQMTPAARR